MRSEIIASILVHLSVGFVFIVFLAIFGNIVWYGMSGLDWEFLLTEPKFSGRAGGISSILISTILILGVCLSIVIPIGLGAGIFLSEFTNKSSLISSFIRGSLDILAGVPSIVFGLFGNAFFSKMLGLGFSILSGGLTLACMVLPVMIRSTEEGFRLIPIEYRTAGLALAFSKSSILIYFLLPAAVPGILLGLVLGIGRALAETAALIFTSGYVDRMPEGFLDSGRSISVHIFDLSMNIPGGDGNAYKSALILMILIFFINTFASYLSKRWMKSRIEVL